MHKPAFSLGMPSTTPPSCRMPCISSTKHLLKSWKTKGGTRPSLSCCCTHRTTVGCSPTYSGQACRCKEDLASWELGGFQATATSPASWGLKGAATEIQSCRAVLPCLFSREELGTWAEYTWPGFPQLSLQSVWPLSTGFLTIKQNNAGFCFPPLPWPKQWFEVTQS